MHVTKGGADSVLNFNKGVENLVWTATNGASFSATTGKKYILFAVTDMHEQNCTASLTGATINSSQLFKTEAGGTHASGCLFICTATSTTVTFTGGNTGIFCVLMHAQIG